MPGIVAVILSICYYFCKYHNSINLYYLIYLRIKYDLEDVSMLDIRLQYITYLQRTGRSAAFPSPNGRMKLELNPLK